MGFKRLLGSGVALSILLAGGGRAWAVLSINTLQYLNQDVGATTFYENGFTGSSAIIANIEGGYIWDQQLLLTQDNVEFSDPSITGQADLHATAVGSVINGFVPFDGLLIVNNTILPVGILDGIAPTAQVWSGAIATSWNDIGGGQYTTSFNISDPSFSTPYLEAMVTGVPEAGNQTADVITSSWETGGAPDGNDYLAVVLDSLAGESGKTLVLSAGNGGPTGDSINSPASGTNAIVVGALQSDSTTPAYAQIADFSSRGPTDFFIPGDPNGITGTELIGARARIDITAPGTDMILAYYGGNTGGGAFGSGAPDPDTGLIAYPFAGTSFSAPIVASGAGLVVDAGKTLFSNDPNAIDGRVVKAVLMNSADKPVGWNNGQFTNGNGVIFTSQALDYAFGAGMLDLNQAWTQYTAGTADVLDITGNPTFAGGSVQTTGWAFGHITHNPLGAATVDYTFNTSSTAGTVLAATLDWYSNELTTETHDGLVATFGSFDNLDLSVFLLGSGSPKLVAESAALYDSVQQLFFALPRDGTYELEVSETSYLWNFTGDTTTDFGLAWSTAFIPEPTSTALLAAGMALLVRPRRRARAA